MSAGPPGQAGPSDPPGDFATTAARAGQPTPESASPSDGPPAGAATLTELFAEQVARTPEATAVVGGTLRLTFAELDRRTDEVARNLARRGVGPEVLVGLYVERGVDMAVGALGILKAGGACVPLDPAFPRERLELIAEHCGASLVLSSARLVPGLPAGFPVPVLIDPDPGPGSGEDGTGREDSVPVPVTGPRPESAAYLMYTSGSTGRPKGVVVEHRGLCGVFRVWEALHGLRADPLRFVSTTSLSVDLFLADPLRSVFAGGTVVIAPRQAVAGPALLLDLLEAERADAVELVPSMAKLARMLPEQPPSEAALPEGRYVLPAAERTEEPAGGRRALPLAAVQQRLWFLHCYAPGADTP